MRKQTDTLRTVVVKVSCVTVNSELERNLHFRDKSIFKIDCVHTVLYTTLRGKLRIMQPLFSIDVQ